MKKLFILAIAAYAAVACARKTITAATEPAEKNLSEAAMAGKTLYSENCGKCHKLPEINSYSEEKWRQIVPPMARKAKLAPEQEKQVMSYVIESL